MQVGGLMHVLEYRAAHPRTHTDHPDQATDTPVSKLHSAGVKIVASCDPVK